MGDFPWWMGGLPVWLASSKAVSGLTCIFAALADKNVIAPLADTVPGIPIPLREAATGGKAPVHMTVTPDGKFLLAANYHGPDNATTSDGAGVSSFAITSNDGMGLGCGLELKDFVPHNGSGPDKSRQGGAHVHSVYASKDGHAFVCDLGQDLIFTYDLGTDGELAELSRVSTAPGAGPRHLVEHPILDFVYSIQEMASTVSSYSKGADGKLELKQTLALVAGDGKSSWGGEIVILPDGSALYASNRGSMNTITTFGVASDGMLTLQQRIEAPKFPRGMALAHGGSLLIVAGQEDSTVASFRVNEGGNLTATGHALNEGKGVPKHPAAFAVVPAASAWTTV